MIKHVIFDCFGVLTEDGWLAFLHKYGTDENIEGLRYANHQADRGVIKYEELLQRVCELTGTPSDEAHRMITATHHPNEAVFNVARKLKADGCSLGVVSNVSAPLTDFLPEDHVSIFEYITLSYEVSAIKPDARIYEAHLEKTGLSANEVIFIDDREPNVVGAEAVGMYGIWFKDAEQLKSSLKEFDIKV